MTEEDHDTWYYYPFPVRDIEESTPPVMIPQTPYLFCETKMARLSAYLPAHDTMRWRTDVNVLELRDNSGTPIDSLHLHNEQQRDELFPTPGTQNGLAKKLDLVAIYKLRITSKTWNEERRHYGYPVKVEDYYVVLWIEEEDGIAYRQASGKVKKDAWEILELEDKSLVLGWGRTITR